MISTFAQAAAMRPPPAPVAAPAAPEKAARAAHLASQLALVTAEQKRSADALGRYLGRADLFTCVACSTENPLASPPQKTPQGSPQRPSPPHHSYPPRTPPPPPPPPPRTPGTC
jgi:hypothetical protein